MPADVVAELVARRSARAFGSRPGSPPDATRPDELRAAVQAALSDPSARFGAGERRALIDWLVENVDARAGTRVRSITVRVSDGEWRELRRSAERVGSSVDDYARRRLLGHP